MHLKKFIPLLFLVITAGLIFQTGLYQYISFSTLQEHYIPIKKFIDNNFILASFIYITVYIAVVGVSIPGSAMMSISGGVLFGPVLGVINAIIGAVTGSLIPFFSARCAAQGVLEKRVGPWAKKMKKGFNTNALSYLLSLRLMPIFPFAAVNLVAGLMQLSFKTFFIGTFVGAMPSTIIFVSMGVAVQEVILTTGFSRELLMNPKIWGGLTGLGILALTPIIYKRFKALKN